MKRFGKKAVVLALVATMAMTSLVGCTGVKDSEIVATVGDSKITAGLANFYVRYQQASIESSYSSYYGEDFWDMVVDEEKGTTFEENMKDSMMEMLQTLYILEDHAKDYKVALTEEETAAIDKAAEAAEKANSEGVREKVSVTKEIVAEYLRLVTLSEKMYDAIIKDADKEVSDKEAAQKRLRYAVFETVLTAEDGSTTELSKEEAAKKKASAEDFLAAAKKNGSLEKYGKEAKQETKTLTFDKESTDLDEAVIKAADALKKGAFAELIETETGYYVVQLESTLDRDATDKEKEAIITERENELYTKTVEKWTEETDITVHKAWKKINIKSLLVSAKPEEKKEETDKKEESEKKDESDKKEETDKKDDSDAKEDKAE